MHRITDALLWVTAIIGTAVIAAMIFFTATGQRPLLVQSGSMAPTIEAGSVALGYKVPASDLQVGDVIFVSRHDGASVMHRILELTPADEGRVEVVLKGDANEKPDNRPLLIHEGMKIGAAVPGFGRAAAMLSSPLAGFVIALVVMGPLLFRKKEGVPQTA